MRAVNVQNIKYFNGKMLISYTVQFAEYYHQYTLFHRATERERNN